jgi:hypothetical protein
MNQEINDRFRARVQDEFDSAADYIWKAPKLISHETKLELEKLDVYFPNRPDLAELRWRHESRKLEHAFPYMIAVGNLLSVASLYETYLLSIARILDRHFGTLDSCQGQGYNRIHSFFKLVGINYSRLETYPAVEAAISIRNCLVHCSGVLEWSRDSTKLRDLITRGRYLSPKQRARRLQLSGEFDEVKMVNSHLGDRVQIDNSYSHIACCYFRDHLLLLVQEASASTDNEAEVS